jgi:hypothetical protein
MNLSIEKCDFSLNVHQIVDECQSACILNYVAYPTLSLDLLAPDMNENHQSRASYCILSRCCLRGLRDLHASNEYVYAVL